MVTSQLPKLDKFHIVLHVIAIFTRKMGKKMNILAMADESTCVGHRKYFHF